MDWLLFVKKILKKIIVQWNQIEMENKTTWKFSYNLHKDAMGIQAKNNNFQESIQAFPKDLDWNDVDPEQDRCFGKLFWKIKKDPNNDEHPSGTRCPKRLNNDFNKESSYFWWYSKRVNVHYFNIHFGENAHFWFSC